MASFEDLAQCDYFGEDFAAVLRAVGWLENPGYPMADVEPKFFDALVDLLIEPWQPVALAGRQRCAFCRFTGGPVELHYDGKSMRVGASNLFVPGDGFVFVAPSLIAHYIDAHGYAPPQPFQEAVTNCPPMRSMAYLKKVREYGLHKLTLKPDAV